MGKFSIIEYSGEAAGSVLARLVGGMPLDEPDDHEVESESEVVAFKTGFQPAEVETEDDDNEPDDA